MAEDKEQWITLKSGKKVKLDENGNIVAGFQGFMGKNISKIKDVQTTELKPYAKPSKSFAQYLEEHGGNKKEAAHKYFQENLQGKYVTATINGQPADIHFTGTTWQEIKKNIEKHPIKANFLENVPEVLQHYKGSGSLTKNRDDFSEFHYFEQAVEKNINGKSVKAKIQVDIGVRKGSKNENEAYHYKASELTEDTKKARMFAEGSGYHFISDRPSNWVPSRLIHLALDKNIPVQHEVVNIEIEILEDKPMNRHDLAMDSASKRSIDVNGFMHVELCNITKESVDPYLGYEIPRHRELGLEPEKIYYGWRKGDELEKAASTFNGLPVMREHHVDSAENPQREHRVGSIGTDCTYNAPYLQASVTITDGEAIRKIESGERMEFSCSYFFEPVFEKGEFNGQPYDFIMTEIKGNHVALTEEGRAGPDVCVADSAKSIKNLNNNRKEDNMPEIKKETQAQDEGLKEELKKDVEFEEKKEELLKDECKPAADDDDDIAEILHAAGIETGDEELKKAFLAGMAYAKREIANPPDTDESKDEEIKKTVIEEKEEVRPAMDANTIKRQIRQELRDLQHAVSEVRPLVGELDAVAFDSGDSVYLKACEVMGVSASKRTARDVCRALLSTGRTPQPVMAMDSGMHGFRSRFDNN